MGDIYYKVNGVWTEVDRVYFKNGVWASVDEVDVKSAGVWKPSFVYDVTPPDPPVLDLTLIDGSSFGGTGRFILVHAHTADPDTRLKRIRVLTTYNGASPTSQYGATYTTEPDQIYTQEPWSDFSFNGYNSSPLGLGTDTGKYKNWPRNATYNTTLASGTHYFAAWAEDLNGNWSTGTFGSVVVPKQATNADILTKEHRFAADRAGSVKTGSFAYGDMVQQNNPRSYGVMFHGNTISNIIGQDGPATIKSAQLYVQRRDDDGKSAANVYLFWHSYPTREDMPGDLTNVVKHEITNIGTISKGESKWFNLPSSFIADLASGNIKGFGFNWKDSDKAVTENDYSVFKSTGDAPRQGELHVVWTEKP